MNRQIKFRAKVKDYNSMTNPDNGWVEGFYFQDLSQGVIKNYIHNCPMCWEVLPETISQFSELKDRNGIDIYEGDIVEYRTKKFVVKFQNGMFYASVHEFQPETYGGFPLHALTINADKGEECEVIGNIQE